MNKVSLKLEESAVLGDLIIYFSNVEITGDNFKCTVIVEVKDKNNLKSEKDREDFLKDNKKESESLFFEKEGGVADFNEYIIHLEKYDKDSKIITVVVENMENSSLLKRNVALIIAHAEAKKRGFNVEEVFEDATFLDDSGWNISLYGYEKDAISATVLKVIIDANTGEVLEVS